MATFVEAAKEAIRSTYCALLSGNDWLNGGIGRLSPSLREFSRDVTAAQRRLAGCDPANDVPPLDPPFAGGQCEDVVYVVTVSGPSTPPGGSGTATRNVRGPVQGMCFPPASGGNVRIGVLGSEGCITGGSGQGLTAPSVQAQWSIIGITRLDGQPDDCGSPPIIYPPPINRPIDIDITFQPDFGPEITVPVTIDYSPFEVNFNGDISFPFTFDFGGFEYSGNIEIAPEVNVNINPPRLPRGGPNPGTGLPGEPGEEVEPLPGQQKIIGVVVNSEIVNIGKVSGYSSPGIPDIFVPRLGSVKFAYSFGGATFWSSDIDVKDARTFIECPFSQGADAVVASPQIGVNMTAVPIQGFPLATTDDIGQG